MHNRSRLISLTGALAASAVLAACSSAPKPLYTQEQFDASSSPYTHTFRESATATCEAARRALLSQGYITNLTRPDTVDGSKNFQPNNDSHVTIEFHVVCVDADVDATSAIAYVNAVQDRYTLKKATTSASVGLSVLGSVSLPIGSSDDSMVKIASETIPAGVFYDRFFKLVDHFLKVDPARHGKAAAKAAETEPVAPLPEPSPSTGAPGDDGAVKLKTPAAPTPSMPSPTPVSGLAPVPVAATGAAAAPAVVAASPRAAAANPLNAAPNVAAHPASDTPAVVAATGTSAVSTGTAAQPIATATPGAPANVQSALASTPHAASAAPATPPDPGTPAAAPATTNAPSQGAVSAAPAPATAAGAAPASQATAPGPVAPTNPASASR